MAVTGWERLERLTTLPMAARLLGRSEDALREWANAGRMPSVRTFGGQLSVYVSWLDAVRASAGRSGPGDMSEVTAAWWAERPAEEVA